MPSLGRPGENSRFRCISDAIEFAGNYNLEKESGLTQNQSEKAYKELFKVFADESEQIKDKRQAGWAAVTLAKLYYEGEKVPQDYKKHWRSFQKPMSGLKQREETPLYLGQRYTQKGRE